MKHAMQKSPLEKGAKGVVNMSFEIFKSKLDQTLLNSGKYT
jgi:hypothetical protein